MRVGDNITKELINRNSLEEFLDNLKRDVLKCYDQGHAVYQSSYFKDFVIGGKNIPTIIIQFTDSNRPNSADRVFNDIQKGG